MTAAVVLVPILVAVGWICSSPSLQQTIDTALEDTDGPPNVQPEDQFAEIVESKQVPMIDDYWVTFSATVPHRKWRNLTTLEAAAKSRKPTVLKHGNIKRWPIFKWTLLDMANNANIALNGTRWQREQVFVLGQDREKGGMIGSPRDHPLSYTNITLEQFLSATFDDSNWLYWTGELSYWEEALNATQSARARSPTGEYQDWRDLRIREDGLSWTAKKTNSSAVADSAAGDSAASAAATAGVTDVVEEDEEDPDASIWRPMLWLSHPGVVAQTHYDTQHNVFVQLQGTKRFLLFPPGTELYSYPNIHRSYRQSQWHLEMNSSSPVQIPGDGASSLATRTQAERFPLINTKKVTALEVMLHPGDVLYIPPYWQHRVESLSLSLSLSILSPSYVEASFAEVFWENVPFGAFQKQRGLRTRAVHMYLSLLVQQSGQMLRNATLQEFAQTLYHTRFETLLTHHKGFRTCFEAAENSSTEEGTESADALLLRYTEKFRLAAHHVAEMLTAIDADDLIKVIFLRDYVEQLVRWAVGPDYTASFIRSCLI
jgi:hypothetical protein